MGQLPSRRQGPRTAVTDPAAIGHPVPARNTLLADERVIDPTYPPPRHALAVHEVTALADEP